MCGYYGEDMDSVHGERGEVVGDEKEWIGQNEFPYKSSHPSEYQQRYTSYRWWMRSQDHWSHPCKNLWRSWSGLFCQLIGTKFVKYLDQLWQCGTDL